MPKATVKKVKDEAPKLTKTVRALEGYVATVSFEGGRRDSDLSNAQIAYLNEHGSPARNVPARPFVGPGVKEALPELKAVARQVAKKALTSLNPGDVASGMRIIAAGLEAAIKKKILTGHFAPLKPATIKRKGHSKPLIDTGQMYDSIKGRVKRRTST
jgi:hypothetical protein